MSLLLPRANAPRIRGRIPAAPVVCLDEKPVTLHADVRPVSSAEPERETRRDNEYERCGAAHIFCIVEPKAGRHFTFPAPDRSPFEIARVLRDLAMDYPQVGRDVGDQIWDNFTIHFAPTRESWLNQAEIEITILSRQCLGARRIPDLKTVRRQSRPWIGWRLDGRAARCKFGNKRKHFKRAKDLGWVV